MANSSNEDKKISSQVNSDIDELNKKIEEVSQTLATIVEGLSEETLGNTSNLKDKARRAAREAVGHSKDALEEVTHRLDLLESKLTETVKDRPALSLGVAAGVGFLAALLLRK